VSGCGCHLVALPKVDFDSHVYQCAVHKHAHELHLFTALVAGNKALPQEVREQARDLLLSISSEQGDARVRRSRVIDAAERFQKENA
jgi:hypothetical protein